VNSAQATPFCRGGQPLRRPVCGGWNRTVREGVTCCGPRLSHARDQLL